MVATLNTSSQAGRGGVARHGAGFEGQGKEGYAGTQVDGQQQQAILQCHLKRRPAGGTVQLLAPVKQNGDATRLDWP